MQREDCIPRIDWERKVEDLGFSYHSMDGIYWDERACYRFSAEEVDTMEAATAELQERCLEAVASVVAAGDYARFVIPEAFHALIDASWKAGDPSLFGRFDLSWNGQGEPKLLEYNADTPTALLEASVVQWYWLQDVFPSNDQFNSLHEKLIERWKEMRGRLPADGVVYFACAAESEEDRGNLDYLRDTATQAGLDARPIDIADLGWNGKSFTDLEERAVSALFKLYPWEWLVREPFAEHLLGRPMAMVEPAWKMLLSNKAILPILWQKFPGHPNLLPASFEPGKFATDFVKKPLYSREGANVTIDVGGVKIEAPGEYGAEGFVYQAYHALPQFGGSHTVIGSWVIGDAPAGIGIREDASPITKNTSRFLPHYFVQD